MGFTIQFHYENRLLSPSGLESTRHFFSDFENNLFKNFPGLEGHTKMDANIYYWLFKKLSYGGHDLQIELATRFEIQDNAIQVISLPDSGSTRLNGGWRFAPEGEQTRVDVGFDLEGNLSLPFFLKGVVNPLAQKELGKLFDEYLSNVEKALKA